MLFVTTRHLDATKTTQTHQNYHRGYPCSSLPQRSFTYTLVVAFTLICSCSPHCRLSRESIHNTSAFELIPRTSPKGTWCRAYHSAYFDSTMILHAWNRRTNECLSTATVYQLLCVQLSCWNIQSGWYGSLMWLKLASISNTKPQQINMSRVNVWVRKTTNLDSISLFIDITYFCCITSLVCGCVSGLVQQLKRDKTRSKQPK